MVTATSILRALFLDLPIHTYVLVGYMYLRHIGPGAPGSWVASGVLCTLGGCAMASRHMEWRLATCEPADRARVLITAPIVFVVYQVLCTEMYVLAVSMYCSGPTMKRTMHPLTPLIATSTGTGMGNGDDGHGGVSRDYMLSSAVSIVCVMMAIWSIASRRALQAKTEDDRDASAQHWYTMQAIRSIAATAAMQIGGIVVIRASSLLSIETHMSTIA